MTNYDAFNRHGKNFAKGSEKYPKPDIFFTKVKLFLSNFHKLFFGQSGQIKFVFPANWIKIIHFKKYLSMFFMIKNNVVDHFVDYSLCQTKQKVPNRSQI